MDKLLINARKAAMILLFVLLSWLMLNVVFNNKSFSYAPLPTVFSAAIWFCVIYWLYILCMRFEKALVKHEKKLIAAFFVVFAVIELFFYSQTAAYPMRDLERVYTGAYNYTIAGVIQDPYLDYFYKFPNNMPITILLQFVFRAFYRLGITNFLAVGALLNFTFIAASYFFIYLCCKELVGIKLGFFAMGLMLMCLPLHGYISVFYTDTLTMVFPPLCFWLFISFHKSPSLKKRIGWLVMFGLALGLGVAVKYSVVIAAVSIVAELFLQKKFKLLALTVLSGVIGIVVFTTAFNSFMYKHILDKNVAKDKSTPMISWIMMGMSGDGSHNAEDNYYVWQYDTYEERVEASQKLLAERISQKGIMGFMSFLNQKGVRSFGSGDLELSQTAALTPMNQTFLLECIHDEGRYRSFSKYVFQGYHVALYVLVALAALLSFKRNDFRFFVPLLSVLGLYLFLLLWESGARYLVNYTPIAVICAAFGVGLMIDKLNKKTDV